MPTDREITVWTIEAEDADTRAALPRIGSQVSAGRLVAKQMDSDVLTQNLLIFLEGFEPVLAKQPKSVGGYHIEEIELGLLVEANGNIGLASAGVEASITFKLKRTG
jgi:hypothetical protein